MSIRNMTDNLDIVISLDNEPNDVGGLTPEQLKAKFDEGPNKIKNYINNTLIPDVNGEIDGVKSTYATKQELQDAVFGEVANITDDMLSDSDGQIKDTVYNEDKVTPLTIDQTPVTSIDTKGLFSAGVEGRTVVNLISNSSFKNGTSGFYTSRATASIENDKLKVVNNTEDGFSYVYYKLDIQANNYYLICAIGEPETANYCYNGYAISSNDNRDILQVYGANTETGKKLTATLMKAKVDSVENVLLCNGNGTNGAIWYMSKPAIYKIEYNNETIEELLEKYHYIDGLQSVQNYDLVSRGKNLFNKYNASLGRISSNGAYYVSNLAIASDFIPIKPNTPYTLSSNSTDYIHNGLIFYDSNKNYTASASTFTGQISPVNARYARITCRRLDVGVIYSIDELDDVKMQLEEGTVATEYQPNSDIVYPVRLPSPLSQLPNGVKDEVFVVGGQYVLEKNTQEYILTSSDIDAVISYTNVDVVRTKIFSDNKEWFSGSIDPIFLEDKEEIIYTGFDDIANIGKFLAVNDQRLWFIVEKGKYVDLADAQTNFFNDYFGKSSASLIYQLAEPQIIKNGQDGFSYPTAIQTQLNGDLVIVPQVSDEQFVYPYISGDIYTTLAGRATTVEQSVASLDNKINNQYDYLKQSVSDGKALLETAIADMEGTVSKAGEVATFAELDSGIRSIVTGKKWASGTISSFFAQYSVYKTISGLDFTPSYFIAFRNYATTKPDTLNHSSLVAGTVMHGVDYEGVSAWNADGVQIKFYGFGDGATVDTFEWIAFE